MTATEKNSTESLVEVEISACVPARPDCPQCSGNGVCYYCEDFWGTCWNCLDINGICTNKTDTYLCKVCQERHDYAEYMNDGRGLRKPKLK